MTVGLRTAQRLALLVQTTDSCLLAGGVSVERRKMMRIAPQLPTIGGHRQCHTGHQIGKAMLVGAWLIHIPSDNHHTVGGADGLVR